MRLARFALAAAALIACAGVGRAASPLLEQATALPGFAMWSGSGAPGLVLGVVQGDDSIVVGFGTIRPKGDHPELPNPEPDGRTLIRLGSISKAFAGELLAGLVVDGDVRLTDPLSKYLPGATVPAFGTREITLLDLATHSAGLPREMGYAPNGTAPFAWPTAADRLAWLGKAKLAWAPGTVAAYSNIGFDLLGDALEGAAGVSYATLLRQRITGPLGMSDTTLAPDAGQCARLMLGTGLGAPAAPVCTDTAATQASGGLYSTGNDMVVWLRHQMNTADAAVSPVLAVSHAIYRLRQTMPAAIGFDEAGPMAGLGLAWVMQAADGPQPMLLEKSGGGGGFMTYVAFAPGRGVGVFVAVDRVDFAMFAALVGAANQLVGELVTR
ncbi:MAG TPA: D-alanyl-D-alanine-carboxypeptidase/endopeptidase AmpH [Acetobacteraceae bacterium]|nr:D-alanyl-D-alanine-carboxypeptidase/endopeptidase AmpH [Acetobacteraceae bacterium]